MELPFVTCMMPTYGRRDYVAESVAMFLAQDYPEKELVILNDCPGQILHCNAPGVRVINVAQRFEHLGDKRNAIIEQSRGKLIAVWDDDDVYLPWRLSYSVEQWRRVGNPLYFPSEFWAYWGESALKENRATQDWISHPSYLFERDLWDRVGRYPSRTQGEDRLLAMKMLEWTGTDWPQYPIARVDRFFVMRGRSQYQHTSIEGGSAPPAIEPGTFAVEPREIADPVLNSAVAELIRRKQRAEEYRTSVARRVADTLPSSLPLDELAPSHVSVGYGKLGCCGQLGYEDKMVEVCGIFFRHALSTHAPARMIYPLDGKMRQFSADVAINDDVTSETTAADFEVRVDGILVAVARNVQPHAMPQRLRADLTGRRELELRVSPHRWDYAHTVWLDPRLEPIAPAVEEGWIQDPLQRGTIRCRMSSETVDRCIATVGSPGYEDWVDDLLGSVVANGQCPEALLAIFFFGDSPEIRRIAEKYHAVIIPCRPLRPLSHNCKAVLYSIARVIRARQYLCLDADMSVQDDLRPLFTSLEILAPTTILAAREAHWTPTLRTAVSAMYGPATPVESLSRYFGTTTEDVWNSPLVINDGIFAGSAAALTALDSELRSMPRAAEWVDDPTVGFTWRNQFVMNLALLRMGCLVELSPRYNIQLHRQTIVWGRGPQGEEFQHADQRVGIVHFSGSGKSARNTWRERLKANPLPLSDCGHADAYPEFLVALRRWLGKYGRDALAWSFYGTTDGRQGRVADPGTFPLYAALASLIRANGCEQVLETGTARGISAACLAAAVAHRNTPRVVTFDVQIFPERVDLWDLLPPQVRGCIETRQLDSLTGMRQALESGERYQAALLDTIHTAEHVLQEFEFATQLVCPGGLILIHDATYRHGTVGAALDEIQRQGYGVVRLWTAETGIQEDDHLGLALIENRRVPRLYR